MRDLDELFAALLQSKFRSRFKLRGRELKMLRDKGLDAIMQHAANLIGKRLAPANILNDGKQTPWRNHPVFVAQHATATCCRGCLEKWHHIPKGHALSAEEITKTTRGVFNALDAIRKLRPSMLGDGLRLCDKVHNVWINGRREYFSRITCPGDRRVGGLI